jgi:hypothetical protein
LGQAENDKPLIFWLWLKKLDKDFGAGAEQLETGKVVNDVSIGEFAHDRR